MYKEEYVKKNINKIKPFIIIKAGLLKSKKENIKFTITLTLQNVSDVTLSNVEVRGNSFILIPNAGIESRVNTVKELAVSNVRTSSLSQIE